MVSMSERQSSMLHHLVVSGEVIWDAEDGGERYNAILNLEEAGLVSAPFVERSERFRWPITGRGRVAVSNYLSAAQCGAATSPRL
jgi:hypothetical protein